MIPAYELLIRKQFLSEINMNASNAFLSIGQNDFDEIGWYFSAVHYYGTHATWMDNRWFRLWTNKRLYG